MLYLVKESMYDPLAVDGIRDNETIPGAPWSRIVFKNEHDVDPFLTREAAEKMLVQAFDLGVSCIIVEQDPLRNLGRLQSKELRTRRMNHAISNLRDV